MNPEHEGIYHGKVYDCSLGIQEAVLRKELPTPTFLFKGWDWNPQSYQSCSREGSGFLGVGKFEDDADADDGQKD